MKTLNLKLSDRYHQNTSGFTLIELLMAISIMGVTASLISYAVSSMITSNQNLAKEQNRRVEASRAVDLIANDIEVSKIVTAIKPTGASSAAVAVLSMDVLTGACSNATINRITYLIKPAGTNQIGPNVLYRHGLVSRPDGTIDCASTSIPTDTSGDGYPIADAIDIGTLNPPTCPSPAVFTGNTGSTATDPKGFYICVNSMAASDSQQVSVALFSKMNGNKIYGINRTITSGFIPTTPTTTSDCTVPPITSNTITSTEPNNTIKTTNNLLYSAINIEVGGTKVITQNPLPNTKLPCGKGLVTYTY